MLNIVKGYKQGRAVMFYDLAETDGSLAREKVEKSEVVNLCNSGQIANAKIQMWEGKAIVRCSNSNLPLVKIDDKGNILGTALKAVRDGSGRKESDIDDMPVAVTVQTKVIGRLSNRKQTAKQQIAFAGIGYDCKNIVDKSQISYTGLETIEDLFDSMAKDFNIKKADEYKQQFARKVNIKKSIKETQQAMMIAIQSSMATYLMNMAQLEIQEAYIKYR